MISFTIPLQPISKKNSQQILINSKTGRPFISPSKAFKQYERAAMRYLPQTPKIAQAVNVKCLFYMDTRRRVDLTNLLEAIDDILVKYRVIEDDGYNIVQSHDGSRVLFDKFNPRVEIYITDAEN